jgi:hypothetical protein
MYCQFAALQLQLDFLVLQWLGLTLELAHETQFALDGVGLTQTKNAGDIIGAPRIPCNPPYRCLTLAIAQVPSPIFLFYLPS